jgi:hypothetical protein
LRLEARCDRVGFWSHPVGMMTTVRFIRFSGIAQALGEEAHQAGLIAPGFRSPPRLAGATRTIRCLPTGGAVVAVVIQDRPVAEVIRDMIDGVVAANELSGEVAEEVRGRLRRRIRTADEIVAA